MRYEAAMLKKILMVVAVIVVAVLGFAATRPDTFEVTRSAQINAPAELVYAQVTDFRAWAAWSPWEKMDPNMKRTFEGPNLGVGAKYAWKGAGGVGTGSMHITEAKPFEHIGLDLVFTEPFPANNRTDFDFVEKDGVTTMTWKMSGKQGFGAKLMGVFMSMDRMVGGDFEKGLASMKANTEKVAAEFKAKKAADAAAAAAAAAPGEAAAVVDAGTP